MSHNCREKKCNGLEFGGLKLICSNCKNINYIECLMKSSYDKYISPLLRRFGIIDSNCDYLNEKVKDDRFESVFDINSIIGYVCIECRVYLSASKKNINDLESCINKLNEKIMKLEDDIAAYRIQVMENETQAKKNKTEKQQQTQKKIIPAISKNGVFSIHVSNFEIGTKTDDIEKIILEKTDIISASFSVEKMRSRRLKHHPKPFASFKISTFKKDICERMLENDVWGSNRNVRIFDEKSNRKIRRESQISGEEKRPPKENVTKPKPKLSSNNHSNIDYHSYFKPKNVRFRNGLNVIPERVHHHQDNNQFTNKYRPYHQNYHQNYHQHYNDRNFIPMRRQQFQHHSQPMRTNSFWDANHHQFPRRGQRLAEPCLECQCSYGLK